MVKITPKEIVECIEKFMFVNKGFAKKGESPMAICFEGEAGMGKTSIPKQFAKKAGFGFHSLVLSQIEDIGDLVGFPYKSVEMFKHDEHDHRMVDWFSDSMAIARREQGWEYTGHAVTKYAEPEWLDKLRVGEQSILLVDDFTRADLRFQQALMQLIQDGSYYSWKLPEGCTIVLTCNPDDGDYLVNAQDLAMSGRYWKFGVLFDIGNWTEWATNLGIDGRCINIFISGYQEMIYSKDLEKRVQGKMDVSPRDWSEFFRFISHLPDFSSKESLNIINKYGKAAVGDAILMFTTALTQKLDILPTPDDLLTLPDAKVKDVLLATCGSQQEKSNDKRYRPEIAAVISMRLNYHLLHVYAEKKPTEEILDRLCFIAESPSFGDELKMAMISLLYSNNSANFEALIRRPQFKKIFEKI